MVSNILLSIHKGIRYKQYVCIQYLYISSCLEYNLTMSTQKQKVLMSDEALKIARENSKKSMPSETQKQFLEDSDREIKEIIDGNRIKFEVHETRILDLASKEKLLN